jgi:hypothetical protein
MRQYDIVGDIHGHAEALETLMRELGYDRASGKWQHRDGRCLLFLGDYIDRGPHVRETLRLVKGLVDSGQALAIAGNHEYNAICFHTTTQEGTPLRPHTEKNINQHSATINAFQGHADEWGDWIAWFRSLPILLDLPGLRAVHATWHPKYTEYLKQKAFTDAAFLHASADAATPEFTAVECVLKGIEAALPDGCSISDRNGVERRHIRLRWWRNEIGSFRDMAFPFSDLAPVTSMSVEALSAIPGYGADEAPVFFGHYWLPGDASPQVQAPNVCCLDYSIANGGRLAAYRWDGESTLDAGKIVTVS